MDVTELLGTALGLGFVAGIRLYATVLALGLAIRFHFIHLPGGAEVLAEPIVLILAGVACLIEFVADKIPWLDSVWDSFHTFIRPIGAAILAATAFGSVDPKIRVILILICGGVAFSSHGSKAVTRLAANHSPEPFSNMGLSFLEDALTPLALFVTFKYPLLAFGLVVLFLVGFVWISRKVFHAIRLRFTSR